MAKLCPFTGENVLYAECVECEEKICRKIQPKESAKSKEEGVK